MADKSIDMLIPADEITPTDLFVLRQDGTSKKLTGQILLNWLTKAADGHGGIQSIVHQATNGLTDTYRITLADTTTFDFDVANGKGITQIPKVSTNGLVDTYRIYYSDGTSTTFTVTNGAKGDKGDNANVWIRYASQEPTESSHDFGVLPDDWMGISSGFSASAPTSWEEYQWFKIKGEKGNPGDPASILLCAVQYLASDSGTVAPSGSWTSTVPAVAQGKYLWTRISIRFNTGEPITAYSVSRYGIDGSGAVSTVNQKAPDSNGNVQLTADDLGARPNDWIPTASDIGAIPTEQKGAANGVATLNGDRKVAPEQTSAGMVSNVGTRSLQLSDAGKMLLVQNSSGADTTLTIPAHATVPFPTGTEIEVFRGNQGKVTIAAADGITVFSVDSARQIGNLYGIAVLKKLSATQWILAGDIA